MEKKTPLSPQGGEGGFFPTERSKIYKFCSELLGERGEVSRLLMFVFLKIIFREVFEMNFEVLDPLEGVGGGKSVEKFLV